MSQGIPGKGKKNQGAPGNRYPDQSNNKHAVLNDFLCAIKNDTRITTAHISLFVMLWNKWAAMENGSSVLLNKYQMMPLCRISSRSTFHKIIKQLHAYGYVNYVPSYNHFVGSRVDFFL